MPGLPAKFEGYRADSSSLPNEPSPGGRVNMCDLVTRLSRAPWADPVRWVPTPTQSMTICHFNLFDDVVVIEMSPSLVSYSSIGDL
jgi:hypothetical protein